LIYATEADFNDFTKQKADEKLRDTSIATHGAVVDARTLVGGDPLHQPTPATRRVMVTAALRMWTSPTPAGFAEASAPTDSAKRAPHRVRVSSSGLGWAALQFERRDYEPSAHALAQESPEHLVFVSLTSGRMVRESGRERVEQRLTPGYVALVPAATPVRWTWSTRVSFTVLRLAPAFVDQVARSVFGLAPHEYRLAFAERAHDNAIANIAGVLAREAMHAEPGGRLYAESLASILAVHLLRHFAQCVDGRAVGHGSPLQKVAVAVPSEAGGKSRTQPRAVSDALSFIHANYARELSLADLAEAVHLSPFHLTRVFKQSLGVSPHQYLIQVRVNSARGLLSAGSGQRSLAEVATAVGFADQSHFTRHFKRATGTTPGQFRV
jgi:AraC family transcriptional regulator